MTNEQIQEIISLKIQKYQLKEKIKTLKARYKSNVNVGRESKYADLMNESIQKRLLGDKLKKEEEKNNGISK